jgi:hypothetical protein
VFYLKQPVAVERRADELHDVKRKRWGHSGENPQRRNSLAERGGFEPAVSREFQVAQKMPKLRGFSGVTNHRSNSEKIVALCSQRSSLPNPVTNLGTINTADRDIGTLGLRFRSAT